MLRSVSFVFLCLFAPLWAGVDARQPQARVTFHQSKSYPFIFVPVPYLELGKPPALRFQNTVAPRRNPPAVPAPTPVPTPESTPKHASTSEPAAPAFPPPEEPKPTPSPEALDTSKYPSEISDFFKNPYNIPKFRRRFLEPVFEPSQAPPSQAKYKEQ